MEKEEIKEMEHKINDYLVQDHKYSSLVLQNTRLIYFLAKNILECYKDLPGELDYNLDYSKITKMGLFDNLKIVQDYYQQQQITFDFEKAVNSGIISYKEYDLINDNDDSLKEKLRFFLYGSVHQSAQFKNLICCNNGLITDSIVLVHELSHLRDELGGYNDVGDFFTEILAITEELIFLDYLKKLGYNEEVMLVKRDICIHGKEVADCSVVLFKIFDLFQKTGNISKDNYIFYYENDKYYEEYIQITNDIITKEYWELFYRGWYILAYAIAPYLYYQNKQNPMFFENIKLLHNKISQGDDEACLKLMGFSNGHEVDLVKVKEALKKMAEEVLLNQEPNPSKGTI